MRTTKRLGICMDHACAYLITFNRKDECVLIDEIQSAFTFEERQHSFSRNEGLMHHKENQMMEAYYKKLGKIIKGYNEVLLFGSTQAKVELQNKLVSDLAFRNIHLEVMQTKKMTKSQMIAFVRDYFEHIMIEN